MRSAEVLFWVLLFLVFYTYIGYGILVWIYLRLRNIFKRENETVASGSFLPKVALIIPAFNEEDFIEGKIENARALDYPADRIKLVVISDGSTDRTAEIAAASKGILHLHQPNREGKSAALNRAAAVCADAEVLVFSDANSILNPEAIRLLVRHYADQRVGGVSGEKIVAARDLDMVQGKGEALYWKYESFLKKLDSAFHTVVGAAGELFSIRQPLFEPVDRRIILDDFYISLRICMSGFVVRYEPGAYATELPSSSMREEEKRKVRISAGAFQSMVVLSPLLNIFRYGRLSFQYISRRVLRWVVCPPALPLLLILNILLVGKGIGPELLYRGMLTFQISFYILAGVGWMMNWRKMGRVKLFYVPYYFVFMNSSVWLGFFRYISKNQTVVWEKSERLSRSS